MSLAMVNAKHRRLTGIGNLCNFVAVEAVPRDTSDSMPSASFITLTSGDQHEL